MVPAAHIMVVLAVVGIDNRTTLRTGDGDRGQHGCDASGFGVVQCGASTYPSSAALRVVTSAPCQHIQWGWRMEDARGWLHGYCWPWIYRQKEDG